MNLIFFLSEYVLIVKFLKSENLKLIGSHLGREPTQIGLKVHFCHLHSSDDE